MIKKIFHKNNYYTKIHLATFKNNSFYLIKWQPKMITSIHNHPNTDCYIYLLKGNLKEIVLNNNKITDTNILINSFDSTFINDKIGYHQVENILNKSSYSIHKYIKN